VAGAGDAASQKGPQAFPLSQLPSDGNVDALIRRLTHAAHGVGNPRPGSHVELPGLIQAHGQGREQGPIKSGFARLIVEIHHQHGIALREGKRGVRGEQPPSHQSRSCQYGQRSASPHSEASRLTPTLLGRKPPHPVGIFAGTSIRWTARQTSRTAIRASRSRSALLKMSHPERIRSSPIYSPASFTTP
jgi:hypothetical protein